MSTPYWYPPNQYGASLPPPQPVPPPHGQGPPPQTQHPNWGWNNYQQPQPYGYAPPMAQYPPMNQYYPQAYGQAPQPVPQPAPQPVPQPVSQPFSQPVPPPVPQPVPQSVPQPVSQPISHPAPQSYSQPMPQPITQSIPQSIPQPISQSIPQSAQPPPQPVSQPNDQSAPYMPTQSPQQPPTNSWNQPAPQQAPPQQLVSQYSQDAWAKPPWVSGDQYHFPERYQHPDVQVTLRNQNQAPANDDRATKRAIPPQNDQYSDIKRQKPDYPETISEIPLPPQQQQQTISPAQQQHQTIPPAQPQHQVIPPIQQQHQIIAPPQQQHQVILPPQQQHQTIAPQSQQQNQIFPRVVETQAPNNHLNNGQHEYIPNQIPNLPPTQASHPVEQQNSVQNNEEIYSQRNGPNNMPPKAEVIPIVSEAIPIPDHLKEKVPTSGTSVVAPVVYGQQQQQSQYVSHQTMLQPNGYSYDHQQYPQESIYSLANQYNSVCMQRTENFFDDCPQSKVPSRLSKPPGARRFNWEDAASSKLFCDMCQIECACESDFVMHFSGKKHIKTQTNLKKIDENVLEQLACKSYDTNNIFQLKCNICEQLLPTVELFQTHMTGFMHKYAIGSMIAKNLRVPDIEPTFESDVEEQQKRDIIRKLVLFEEDLKKGIESALSSGLQNPTPPKRAIPPAAKKNNVLLGAKFVVRHPTLAQIWYCKLCKVDLSPSQSVQVEHCRGKQHRGNFIWRLSESDNEVLTMVNGEEIPLVSRTNWQEDHSHYSADPNILIAFEAFRDHPSVPHPIINQQIFATNKNTCRLIDFTNDDRRLEKKSSEITNGKASIAELYELVKYISKVAYKITYAINEVLLEFKPNESNEVRFKKSRDTATYKVAQTVFVKQLDNLPQKVNCYYTTVVRTDIIGKGYILDKEEKLDVVMVCDFLPTTEILKLYEAGFLHILNNDEDRGRTINVNPSVDGSSISIIYLSEDLYPIIEINIKLTSKMYKSCDLKIIREMSTILNVDKGLVYLAEIRQMRWFKEKHIYYPYFMFVIRILRDFRRRNPVWSPVSLFSMELVLDHLLRNCKTFVSPSILIRNFFKFFASVKLNTQTLFGDVCEVNYSNPFKHLTDAECGKIQSTAITVHKWIKSNKIDQALHQMIPVIEHFVAKDLIESQPQSNGTQNNVPEANNNALATQKRNDNDQFSNANHESSQDDIKPHNDSGESHIEARFSDDQDDDDQYSS